MKLALALSERADLQRRISDLDDRLCRNARVQEGEKPSEDPNALLKEMEACYVRLEELIGGINRTNNETKCGDVTLTELLAKRDCLDGRVKKMRNFLSNASNLTDRYSKTEIKMLSTVPVAELQKKVDALSRELRETDEKIQEINWTTELL